MDGVLDGINLCGIRANLDNDFEGLPILENDDGVAPAADGSGRGRGGSGSKDEENEQAERRGAHKERRPSVRNRISDPGGKFKRHTAYLDLEK